METTAQESRGFPAYDPSREYAVKTFDVEYRRDGGEGWLATIYQPEGEGPFPALLDVHGGAWCAGDRKNNEQTCQALAASGLVLAAIDFRLGPQHPYPASIADVNYGTRWLKAHAPEFNADPRHVGGLGASSGGHQIMLSALRPRDGRYAALPLSEAAGVDASLAYVVALWPILDPYARYLFAKETGRGELVKRTEGYFVTESAMQEGNPTLIVERGEPAELPPALIIQGTADTNVTPAMQERFVAAYRQAGGSVELEIFPDQPHGFGNTPGDAADRALALVKAFVARQLAPAASAR